MPTYEWARNADAIEDARDEKSARMVGEAVSWAIANDHPEADTLIEALTDVFCSQGNRNASSCATNRAIEIVMDAYLADQKSQQEAA